MKFNRLVKGGLAAVMAMGMMACSNSNPSGGGTTEPTAQAAFKLGFSGPLTGDASVYGLAVQHAVEIAVEEINDQGGVQFEVNAQDDQADGQAAVTAYNALMDWGMQISLLTVTSGAGQAVAPNYQKDNVFAITPSASSTAVIFADPENSSGAYGTVFQMCFTDPNQGTASADYLKSHTELGTKVAVIYRSDDNYSSGIYNTFMAEANKVGLEVVSESAFVEADKDFSVQVKQAADAGADIVFLPIYYQPASQILVEANKQGYKPTFFGCDGMDGILTLENFDTSLAEGLYMITPFSADATDEKTANFVKKYQEKYGDVPNQFAADAYDCVYAIKQALEAGNVTPDMSTDDITAALVKQFTSMKFDGLTGLSMTWAETGEVSKTPKAVVIQNGTYVGVED
ncbi:MAG: amino acid ABC transporter substrate-binding protein [Erysipelotrichaceae bacterium]|nr:amino acid ABC transporter substrate-binding protein [Erysipelotrichaceae bacterium]